MSQVLNVVLNGDEVEVEEYVSSREVSVQLDDRERMNAEARRRIEKLREDAALKAALNDDIFDY